MAQRIAFAATACSTDLDDGWPELHGALVAAGAEPVVAVWDDPGVTWEEFDLVVAMYTWGYVTQREEFLWWATRTSEVTRLANSVAHLRWSSDKTYLADLDAMGFPVVPTTWLRPGDAWQVPSGDYVVKPTVASGGLGAARYADSDPEVADRHIRDLHAAGHTVMVQPYQRSIDSAGETALVFLGDRYSHAVNKGPLLEADAGVTDALWEREVITPIEPPAAHLALGQAVIDTVRERLGPTTYARVDVVGGDADQARVLEVELVSRHSSCSPRLARLGGWSLPSSTGWLPAACPAPRFRVSGPIPDRVCATRETRLVRLAGAAAPPRPTPRL